MKLNVIRISIDRRTGETLGEKNIGSIDVETNKVARASVALLTGMSVNLLHPIEDGASYFIDRCLLLFTAGLTQSP